MQQANHTQQDRFRRLHGAPALGCALVPVLVVLRRVQDRNADEPRGIHVGVKRHGRAEGHGGWVEGVGGGEGEAGGEVGAWVR